MNRRDLHTRLSRCLLSDVLIKYNGLINCKISIRQTVVLAWNVFSPFFLYLLQVLAPLLRFNEAYPMPTRPSSVCPCVCPESTFFLNPIGSLSFHPIFPIFGSNVHKIWPKNYWNYNFDYLLLLIFNVSLITKIDKNWEFWKFWAIFSKKVWYWGFVCHNDTYRKISNMRCSNYIFISDLTSDVNGLDKDNCKTRRYWFKFWYLVRLILEIWRYTGGVCALTSGYSRSWQASLAF